MDHFRFDDRAPREFSQEKKVESSIDPGAQDGFFRKLMSSAQIRGSTTAGTYKEGDEKIIMTTTGSIF